MRIVVNDVAASKTGALSILKDFYQYVKDHDTENEWVFLLGGNYLAETDRIRVVLLEDVKKSRLKRLLFEGFSFQKVLKDLKPDVYFSMQNTLPRGYAGKQALYVHQPLGYQNVKRFSLFKKSEREYAIYQHLIAKLIDASVKRADLIIVQTGWMREAVLAKTHVPKDKVVKILPTIADLSQYAAGVNPSPDTFFYPSGNISYKNHSLLYMAAGLLVQRGLTDFKIYVTLTAEELRQHLPQDADEKILSHFVCMGRVEREEVLKMYQKSTLVFPSYIETFGYPPAEARQIGTLVLSSDCPFSREVLDGYENAYYFDPFDAKVLSDLMEDVITGKIALKAGKAGAETSAGTETSAGMDPAAGTDKDKENSWAQVVELLTALGR